MSSREMRYNTRSCRHRANTERERKTREKLPAEKKVCALERYFVRCPASTRTRARRSVQEVPPQEDGKTSQQWLCGLGREAGFNVLGCTLHTICRHARLYSRLWQMGHQVNRPSQPYKRKWYACARALLHLEDTLLCQDLSPCPLVTPRTHAHIVY